MVRLISVPPPAALTLLQEAECRSGVTEIGSDLNGERSFVLTTSVTWTVLAPSFLSLRMLRVSCR